MRARNVLLPAIAALAGSAGALAVETPQPRPSPVAARPAPAPTLEGIVRGPDGKPIEKALVVAMRLGSLIDEPNVSTRTDAQGRFRLDLRSRSKHRVRAEAIGLAGRTLKDVVPGAPLTLDLARGGTIEGVVRDGETGQPAPGVRVETWDKDAIDIAEEPDAGRIHATSDAQGRFTLARLGVGRHDVTARARGRGPARRKGVASGTRLELTLRPSATLYGVVTGPDGTPVGGAFVWPIGVRGGQVVPPERSDARGRYEVAGLAGGLYDVAARADGFAPSLAPDVVLSARNETRLDVALQPGARVTGRLVDAKEAPLAGRIALGEVSGHATPGVLLDRLVAQTDADGRFVLDAVPVGDHALGANAPGQAPKRVELSVAGTQRQLDLGDVRMESGLTIRGRVRTPSGEAVADASVQAYPTSSRSSTLPRTSTDGDGVFVLAGLEPETYRVTAFAHGRGHASAELEPASEPVELIIDPFGTIAGRVVDARGRAVDAFRVVARPVVQGQPLSFSPFETDDGRFELPNVEAGSYVVSVEANEHGSATVPARVVGSRPTDVGTVKLQPGSSLRGSVVDSAGASVEGARVEITRPPTNHSISFGTEPEIVTDRSGAFEAKGLEPGSVELRASPPDHAPSAPAAILVESGPEAPEVRLVMGSGGRIEGSLRRRDGAPLGGALLSVAAAGPSRMAEPSTATQADGSFVVEHVPAGRMRVTAFTPSGQSGFRSAVTREADVREGETVRVDMVVREVLLTGRVTRSGTPAPGLRVTAEGTHMSSFGARGQTAPPASGGPERMAAVTREDGGFEMRLDEPGTIRLNVESADGRSRFPSRRIEVPDTESFAVDLDFPVVPVSGIVVDAESDAPLPYAFVFATPKPWREGGGTGRTGPDGRFQLELEPGAFRLGANDKDGRYANAQIDVSVGPAGLADVRLALSHGLRIAGRAVDPEGRSVPGVEVQAVAMTQNAGGSAETLADGSFEIRGLQPGAYVLKAWSASGLYGLASDVEAGALAVPLRLSRGGLLRVETVGTDGSPVSGVWISVSADPALGYVQPSPTDATGLIELRVPASRVSISARKDALAGSAVLNVASGETKPVRVVMEAR